MLLLLVAMLACDDGPGPNATMDVDLVRSIAVEAHLRYSQRRRTVVQTQAKAQAATKCSGDWLAASSRSGPELRRGLAELVRGPAEQCYFASYFGCTTDGRVARTDVAVSGPAFGPHNGSKVVLVEKTKARAIADVSEVEVRFIDPTGDLRSGDDPNAATEPLVEKTSRYTFARDAAGYWHIVDRKPNFAWECRGR